MLILNTATIAIHEDYIPQQRKR